MRLQLKQEFDDILAPSSRRKAQRLGLQVIGTVGIIVLAHRQRRIDGQTAVEWLGQLVHQHGLYLSVEIQERLKAEILDKP